MRQKSFEYDFPPKFNLANYYVSDANRKLMNMLLMKMKIIRYSFNTWTCQIR